MQVIAHRGANNEALENSFAAFEAAIDANVKRIELDVRLTKDNKAIVMHDSSLLRTTGFAYKVNDLSLDEITKITLSNGEKIPQLEDVVERILPTADLNIELKDNCIKTTDVACAIVQNSPHKDRVIISSFYSNPLAHLRDKYPDLPRACLWGFARYDSRSLSHHAPQLMMERFETNIFHPCAELVTSNMMEQAKLRGWTVYPWALYKGYEDIDRERLWTALKTYQVDGLCTNYPRHFRAWLKEAALDESKYAQANSRPA